MTSVRTSTRRTPLIALLAADGISRAGNAVTTVAVPLYALAVTGSPFATGIAGVFATAPIIVGGALGGVLVDRFGWRRSGVVADAASGLTSLAIPVLAGLGILPFPALLALVFLSNLLDTPGSTARTAQLPELAELAGTPLSRATGAHATVSRTAGMLGVGLAGALVAVVGPANALYACGVFAVSIALTLLFVPADARHHATRTEEPAEPYLGALRAGLRFTVRTPLLRAVVILVVTTNMIDAAGLTVLKPVYARGIGDDGAVLGAILAVFAAGALTGAAAYSAVGHRLPRRGLFVALFLLAGVPPYLALALDAPLPAIFAVLALSGLAAGPLNPMIDTALFGIIPVALRARVFGALSAGVAAAMPLGSALAGLGVEQLGLTGTLFAAAGVYLVAILSTAFGRRWHGF
ncbi:MAG TPA: MFS transporter [Pseudolysinimonas sp.]|nr:MFS transporter [Pseudolysinimonas sp.]